MVDLNSLYAEIDRLKESLEEWKKAWRLEDAALIRAEEEIRNRDAEIAGLNAAAKRDFEAAISIMHDQGAENLILKDQITELKAQIQMILRY